MVEEILLSSLQPGGCKGINLAHQIKQEKCRWKFSTEKLLKDNLLVQ